MNDNSFTFGTEQEAPTNPIDVQTSTQSTAKSTSTQTTGGPAYTNTPAKYVGNINYKPETMSYEQLMGVLRAHTNDTVSSDAELLKEYNTDNPGDLQRILPNMRNLTYKNVSNLIRGTYSGDLSAMDDESIAKEYFKDNPRDILTMDKNSMHELYGKIEPYPVSTVGGVAKGAPKALAEAATDMGTASIAGSVAGGAIGGPVGAVIGASAGGAADKMINNVLTGKPVSQDAGINAAIQGGFQAILPGVAKAIEKTLPYVSAMTPDILKKIATQDIDLPTFKDILNRSPKDAVKSIVEASNKIPAATTLPVEGLGKEIKMPFKIGGTYGKGTPISTILDNLEPTNEGLQFVDKDYIDLRDMLSKPGTPESNIINQVNKIKANPGPLSKLGDTEWLSRADYKAPGIDDIKEFRDSVENRIANDDYGTTDDGIALTSFDDFKDENKKTISKNLMDAAKTNPQAIANMSSYIKGTAEGYASEERKELAETAVSSLTHREQLNKVVDKIQNMTDPVDVFHTLASEPITNELFKTKSGYIDDFENAYKEYNKVSTGQATVDYKAAERYADTMVDFRNSIVKEMISTNTPQKKVSILGGFRIGIPIFMAKSLIFAHPIVPSSLFALGIAEHSSPAIRLATLNILKGAGKAMPVAGEVSGKTVIPSILATLSEKGITATPDQINAGIAQEAKDHPEVPEQYLAHIAKDEIIKSNNPNMYLDGTMK